MDADTQSTDIQATEVCFFAERGYRWKGEHPWILTTPVSELAYRLRRRAVRMGFLLR